MIQKGQEKPSTQVALQHGIDKSSEKLSSSKHLAMISPIHSRLNHPPVASQENLGDETRELVAMKNDIKTP